jgi:4-hydroxy-tetrahydrodipicolinate synthase
MIRPTLIAAIGTPLTKTDGLHREGLESHLADQWNSGMSGVLVAGTMGAMQMLTDATYRQLVDSAIEFSRGKGEIMVGAGDTSFGRTREKIRFLNDRKIDGAVVLSPYFIRFSQNELIDYFQSLAEISKHPLFLYDLPILTGTKLELETVQQLSQHPNIRGIKCSGDFSATRQLLDSISADFRVIVAQADLVDVLLRHGVREHLDGVFSLAPLWIKAIERAASQSDWATAAHCQQQLSGLLRILKKYGVFQVFSLLANARGISGNFAPPPFRRLSEAEQAAVMNEPVAKNLIHGMTDSASDAPTVDTIEFEPSK